MTKMVVGQRITYVSFDKNGQPENVRGSIMAVRQPVKGSVKIDVILDNGVSVSGWDGQ